MEPERGLSPRTALFWEEPEHGLNLRTALFWEEPELGLSPRTAVFWVLNQNVDWAHERRCFGNNQNVDCAHERRVLEQSKDEGRLQTALAESEHPGTEGKKPTVILEGEMEA